MDEFDIDDILTVASEGDKEASISIIISDSEIYSSTEFDSDNSSFVMDVETSM